MIEITHKSNALDHTLKARLKKLRQYLWFSYANIGLVLIIMVLFRQTPNLILLLGVLGIILATYAWNLANNVNKLNSITIDYTTNLIATAKSIKNQLQSMIQLEKQFNLITFPLSFALGVLLSHFIKGKSWADLFPLSPTLVVLLVGSLLWMTFAWSIMTWLYKKKYKSYLTDLETLTTKLPEEK